MIKDTDIAWLAGIMDGEGCICGHWANRGRYSTGGTVAVEVRIEATSFAMIAKVAEIYEALGVVFTFDGERRAPLSTKTAQRLNVRRKAEVAKLLKALLPYLIVKKAEAEAAIEWTTCKGRQTADDKVVFFTKMKALKRNA